MYYYGARYYAAWIGRFISIDPLAEKFPQLTPYNYAGNKPVTYKDLHGLQSTEENQVKTGKPESVEDLENIQNKVIRKLANQYDEIKKSIGKSWDKLFSSNSVNNSDNVMEVDAISGASIPISKTNISKEEKINYAQKLLDSKNVTLIKFHPNKHTPDDEANAPDNIKDAAKGKEVKLSNYGNAPGGTVELDEKLLKGLYELSKDYKFSIQELAGASHSKNSTHYKGKAVDINWLNGKHVGANHPDAKKFIKAAKKLGFSVNNEWKMAKGAHFHMSIK